MPRFRENCKAGICFLAGLSVLDELSYDMLVVNRRGREPHKGRRGWGGAESLNNRVFTPFSISTSSTRNFLSTRNPAELRFSCVLFFNDSR